jgi:hypothetical protein
MCGQTDHNTAQCSFTQFEQRTLKNLTSQKAMSKQQLHDSSVFRMTDIKMTAVILS